MIRLAPFTKQDWYGFAGAEPFADGSEPLIGYFSAVDAEGGEVAVIAVLDANGLGLIGCTEEGGEVFSCFFSGSLAARASAALHEGVSLAVLAAMPGADFSLAQEAA